MYESVSDPSSWSSDEGRLGSFFFRPDSDTNKLAKSLSLLGVELRGRWENVICEEIGEVGDWGPDAVVVRSPIDMDGDGPGTTLSDEVVTLNGLWDDVARLPSDALVAGLVSLPLLRGV